MSRMDISEKLGRWRTQECTVIEVEQACHPEQGPEATAGGTGGDAGRGAWAWAQIISGLVGPAAGKI